MIVTWYTKFSYNVAGIRESRFNWLAQFSEASSIFFRQDPIHMVLMLNTFLHGPQNRSLQRDINTIPRTFSACGFFFSLIFDNGAICYWLINLRFSITNTWRLHLKLSTMTFNVMLKCLWTWFILLFLVGELLSVLVDCHSESKKRCPGSRFSAVQSDFWNCPSISTPENIPCQLYMKYRN